MKNHFLKLLMALLIGLWGCSDRFNDLESPNFDSSDKTTLSRPLDGAVYNEVTESWILPQNDPYTLENFQNAYNNLSSGNSMQALTKSQVEEFSETEKLTATHYVVKLFPKNEFEQGELELMDDVVIAYAPFNYDLLTPEETERVRATTKSSVAIFQEKSPYTITYSDYLTIEGFVDTTTYMMPILYAVWPCEKSFPDNIQYEISYEVFLPDYAMETKSSSLNTDALFLLEKEAITLALGAEASNVMPMTKVGIRTISAYDNILGRAVPINGLKVRIKLGSNSKDVVTSDGLYMLPESNPIYSGGSFYFIYESTKWKITTQSSSAPINVNYGRFPPTQINGLEAHCLRGVDAYYHNAFPLPTGDRCQIRIIASQNSDPNAAGKLHYSNKLGDNPYITIYNNTASLNDHEWLIGSVLHELGHYLQFCMMKPQIAAGLKFNGIHDLLRESFASYVSWEGVNYYYRNYLGQSRPTDFNTHGRQSWFKTTTVHPLYSPLFIDLCDDYNQNLANTSYMIDQISNFNRTKILEAASNCSNWTQTKNKLLEGKNSSYFTVTQLNNYLANYDYWFANN